MTDTDKPKTAPGPGDKPTGDNGTVLAEWGSTHVWRTRVSLRTYKGKRLLDMRRHWDPGSGMLLPTKKGICLEATDDNISQLEAALKLARKELGKENTEDPTDENGN